MIVLRSGDAPRMTSLHAAAASDPWPVEEYRNLLKQGTSLALGTAHEETDSLKAFVLSQIAVDTADILMIATSPQHQRQGLAKTILGSLIKRLGERGVERITLDVAADNDAAIALYGAMEFAIDGRRPKYYRQGKNRVDAILMSRPVTGLPQP